MFTIAFICTANMCRSVMAHAICVPQLESRGWAVEVYSGGTMDMGGTAPVARVRDACGKHQTPPRKKASTFVRDLPLASIDRFFVMEQHHFDTLVADYGIEPSRILLLGHFDPQAGETAIDDPIGKDAAAFEHCYERLQRCIVHYLDTTAEIPVGSR
jgi:protein-tyrosine-phosphatase